MVRVRAWVKCYVYEVSTKIAVQGCVCECMWSQRRLMCLQLPPGWSCSAHERRKQGLGQLCVTVRVCTSAGLKLQHMKSSESAPVVLPPLAYQRENRRLGHGNVPFLHSSAEAGCHKHSAASDLDCLAQILADFPFYFCAVIRGSVRFHTISQERFVEPFPASKHDVMEQTGSCDLGRRYLNTCKQRG